MRTESTPGARGPVFCGVDTHADSHWLCVLDWRGRRVLSRQFPADAAGYEALAGAIAAAGEPACVAMEGTSSYGAGLTRHLASLGMPVREALSPARTQRRRPGQGKCDEADAERAARAAMSGSKLGVPKSQDGWVDGVRCMLAARSGAVKARTSAVNTARSLLTTAPEGLRSRFRGMAGPRLMEELPSVRAEGALGAALGALADLWAAARDAALDMELAIEASLEENCPALLAMYGCGPVSAAKLAVAAGDNPGRLRSEASFAAICGACPIPASSGKTVRHRLNRGGDRQANSALHEIARQRVMRDPETAEYAERARGRGKSDREVMRCLKRYVAREAYRALMRPHEIRRPEWIGYTDVDSSGRGAGDGRAVYEGPQAPEAFHRRVQEADSRPLQRRQAQARDHGRVRPRQEHRGEVDQVDKRDRLAARRVQPHARAEPDPGARAREPQAPDGGRRLKTSGADIRSKVRAIAANEGRYPISAQCRLLGVARSTYYSMRSRADRPAAPDPAAPAVVAAHAASKGRYGSRKIKASLERSGVTVSRRRVCRIMRENGLVSAYGRKRFKVHPGAVNEADVPNVVARGFGGRAPRTHICSDLTYVRVGASWNYVCLLVDLYNREIVGHSAGPRKDARLVKSAFATLSFPISDIEVFHTDRGSEFDNAEIDLMLEAFGIERSLSAKGCPYDNAVDESTNRILKAELVHRETFGTTRELRAKLSDYVHWYNNFRIRSTLGYMSPVEFREAGLSLPESSK